MRSMKECAADMENKLVARAESIMRAEENAIISLVDEDGFPRTSAISNLKTEGIKYAWFATGLCSGKARCIQKNNKAGLCYCDGSNNVTLMGKVEILTEAEIKKAMWLDWFIEHFPEGTEDPNYCILKFTTEKVVLWIDSEYVELNISQL